jgi:hypothetical protein
MYEELCTAKLKKRHCPYQGMAIAAGAIGMAKDDDKDVSQSSNLVSIRLTT